MREVVSLLSLMLGWILVPAVARAAPPDLESSSRSPSSRVTEGGAASHGPSQQASAPTQVSLRFVLPLVVSDDQARHIGSWFPPSEWSVSFGSERALRSAEVMRQAGPPGTTIWITEESGTLRLFFVHRAPARKPRYMTREVSRLEHEWSEIELESIAQIVHATARALRLGEEEISRAEMAVVLKASTPDPALAPPTSDRERPPATTAREEAGAALGVQLGYGASVRGDEGLAQGPRLSGLLRLAPPVRLVARLSLELPAEVDMGDFDVDFVGGELFFGAAWAVSSKRGARLVPHLGAGLNLVSYESVPAGSEATDDRVGEVELRPLLRAGVALEFLLSRRWFLSVSAEARVPLVDTTYVAMRGAEVEELGSSWPVHPGLALDLGYF